jgi:adenylate cyclase
MVEFPPASEPMQMVSAGAFRLVCSDTGDVYDLSPTQPMTVGRGSDVDITIVDETISRRHAQLEPATGGVLIRDLRSSNGTFLNGRPVDVAQARAGDTIGFGKVSCRLEPVMEHAGDDATEPLIVRQRPVQARRPLGDTLEQTTVSPAMALPGQELTQRKLELLLDVSTALGRVESTDALLEQIAGYVFQIMDVDRVAILLAEGDELVARVARDRRGGDAARAVPRSIARRVVTERIAVLSDNAPEDERFAGASIVMQSVRSAMCAPLIGLDGVVTGVLYVDNLTATQRFDDSDLEFLIAFSGIAAVAIENGRYAERVQREALARGNFERFFTPALAARIAASADALQLGGEKRRVAILFSDIRGFTSMSEHMPPEQLAALLSEYFTAMVDCVFRHGGTLDKFIGGAIMARWGAPVHAADDADRALRAAFDMQDELATLNEQWSAAGRPTLGIGIGLNVGDVFAGYVGSERRLEYTILGDPVNLASRLCSVAAAGEILVSGAMLGELAQQPQTEARSGLILKGLTRDVGVHAVVGRPTGRSAQPPADRPTP